ncbi:uncharacterized protein METZ01_LOCUS364365, partial [marine metagenome]
MVSERRRRRYLVENELSRRDYLRSKGGLVITAMLTLFSPQTVGAQQAQRRIFSLTVSQGQVAAKIRTIKVLEGDLVELHWIADEKLTLHLHGYDVTLKLLAGEPGTMGFTAHAAGRYPVAIRRSTDHKKGGHHGSAVL